MPAALIVDQLRKSYDRAVGVAGIGFQVQAGEIFGLLGPNGAGKTSAIECILGIRAADSGTITIGGFDLATQAEQIKQIIGTQLQATALQDKLTPRAALKFFASFYRNPLPVDELLARFGLVEKAQDTFDTLSTGQRQRLALALAFVNNPAVLFLDEPTAGLDPRARRDLHEDIRRFKTDGRAVLLSTHYIEEAQELCDRIAIMNAGQIVAIGKPSELLDAAKLPTQISVQTEPELSPEMFSGHRSIQQISAVNHHLRISTFDVNGCVMEIIKCINGRQLKLLDLHIERPTLEDLFLSLTGSSIDPG